MPCVSSTGCVCVFFPATFLCRSLSNIFVLRCARSSNIKLVFLLYKLMRICMMFIFFYTLADNDSLKLSMFKSSHLLHVFDVYTKFYLTNESVYTNVYRTICGKGRPMIKSPKTNIYVHTKLHPRMSFTCILIAHI